MTQRSSDISLNIITLNLIWIVTKSKEFVFTRIPLGLSTHDLALTFVYSLLEHI